MKSEVLSERSRAALIAVSSSSLILSEMTWRRGEPLALPAACLLFAAYALIDSPTPNPYLYPSISTTGGRSISLLAAGTLAKLARDWAVTGSTTTPLSR